MRTMCYAFRITCHMTVIQQRLWIFLLVGLFRFFGDLSLVNGALKTSEAITSERQAGDQPVPYRVNMPMVYVLENATVGSVIVQDIRTHLGLPTNSLVKLGPGSLTQFFRLDSDSGRLVTVAKLDLESPEICQAEKSCCRQEVPNSMHTFSTSKLPYPDSPLTMNGLGLFDSGRDLLVGDTCRMMAFILSQTGTDNQLTPITRLYVTVVDLNDNAPVFRTTTDTAQQTPVDSRTLYNSNSAPNEIPLIKLAFSEGPAGLHSRHDLPTAYDGDFSMTNRVKRYWLEWSREKTKLSLEAKMPDIHGTIPNVLNVEDQNGLAWANLGPFRLIYLEPGRSIALELDAELDREQQDSYQLRLVAEDGGGLRGQMKIDVDVLDVNEYTPVFADEPPTKEQLLQHKSRAVYRKRYSVKESLTSGSELGQLRAYDADQSPASGITYRLGPGNPSGVVANTFQIHPRTGVLKLIGNLDYETTQHYRLTVIAQDCPNTDVNPSSSRNSVPRTHLGTYRSATAIVEINVIDVNDNAPVIRFEKEDSPSTGTSGGASGVPIVTGTVSTDPSKTPYEVRIKEDLPKGSPVTFFSVSDRDLADNGRVTCNLVNWTERFRLREFTGLYGLETLDTFDREQVDAYYVTVRCHDHGVPVLQTDRALLIHIEDVNDLPPVFELPVYQFHVQENSPPGTPLQPISANFPARVTATDPDLNSTIKYHLEPRAIGSKSIGLMRSEQNAVRSDGPGAIDHQLFHIDPSTGLLTTQGELDREERARLGFQVCANDGKHVACTDVIVLLDDVNDNRPQFDRDTYVLRVEENQLSHKPILTFHVTDADAGNHGFVYDFWEDPLPTFEPKHNPRTLNSSLPVHDWEQYEPGSVRYHFALRENTLYVRRPLDREFRSNYHFFITVTDSQESPRIHSDSSKLRHAYITNLTSKAEIFIDVGDVNDNTPMFIFPNSTGPSGNRLSISCHETMGSSVGRLQATDPDLGSNATVTFSLIHTPEVDQLFYLDGQSGELYVNTGQLVEKCGDSLIMVVSVDDLGPPESKQSRPAPVERMLIKIEDKPTLAELIAAEARQQWRGLAETGSDGRLVKQADGTGDGTFAYGALSTRTILSVVLGGSTVFLIGLLIVWMILLLYNRTRRRKHMRAPDSRRFANKPRVDPGSPQSVLSGESPEKGALFGTLNSTETENQYCEQFVRNMVQNDKPDTIAIHQTAVPVNMDYYRCVADPELGYLTGKDGTYGKCTAMRLTASPTITSRISSTPPTNGPDGQDYTTRLWHPEHDLYHTCVSEQCRIGAVGPLTSHNTLRRSPGGLELATMSRAPKETSTFGRLLPRWIVNNIVPRQQTNKEGYSMGKDACMLREKRLVGVNNSSSVGHRFSATQPQNFLASPVSHARAARTLEKPSASHSSPGCSTHPDPSAIAYTSLRRCTVNKPSDRVLNNQTEREQFSRASYPFLTPPASRRDAALWDRNTENRQPQTVMCMNKGDYTSLLRPEAECELRDCPARPSSSIPMLSFTEPTQSDSPSLGTTNIQTGRRIATTPTGQLIYPTPTSYPCCSACEPLLAGNTSLLNSCDLISPGDSHTNTDSMQNCPQCRMMTATMLPTPCCPDNCSLMQPSMHRTATHSDEAAPTGSVEASNLTDPQCSTAYMSMQEMLNSCV